MKRMFLSLIVLVSLSACCHDPTANMQPDAGMNQPDVLANNGDAVVADTRSISVDTRTVADVLIVKQDGGSTVAADATTDTTSIGDVRTTADSETDDRLVLDVSIGSYPTRIIVANSKDNPVIDIVFPGTKERVSVQALSVRFRSSRIGSSIYSSLTKVAFYDQAGLKTGKPFCTSAVVEGGWVDCIDYRGMFVIDALTTVTVKVDVEQVGSPEKNLAVSGETFTAEFSSNANLNEPGHGYFLGVGEISGKRYTTGLNANGRPVPISQTLIGNTMYIYKTKPTFATAALRTYVLINGEQTLNVTGLTVDSNNDLGITRLTYGLYLKNVGAFGSLKLYAGGILVDAKFEAMDYKGSYDVGSATVKGVANSTRLLVDLSNEAVFSRGSYTEIEIRGTVEGAVAGSEASLSLIGEGGPYPSHTAIGPARTFIADAITWSDHSDDNHSAATNDWIGGALIPPTISSTLTL